MMKELIMAPMVCAAEVVFDDNILMIVVLVGLLIGIIVIRAIIRLIFMAKPPATFRCARCKREVPHNNRTIEAWRSGKHKFFCQECHQKWREMHPAVRESSGGGSGCMLPLALILSLVAIGAYSVMRFNAS